MPDVSRPLLFLDVDETLVYVVESPLERGARRTFAWGCFKLSVSPAPGRTLTPAQSRTEYWELAPEGPLW